MAVQQRIIGGGLLLAGIAVVLILIFVVWSPGTSAEDAYESLKDIHSKRLKADADGDYLTLQRLAEQELKLEKDTAMAPVMTMIEADAAKGNDVARALKKLLDGKVFENNAQGRFEFEGTWYDSTAHATLRRLKRALEDGVPALVAARKAATGATTEIEKLRLGSGHAIAFAATDASGKNPVCAADAQLFAVLGLPPPEVTKALAAKADNPKAKTARLVWNQETPTAVRAQLAKDLATIAAVADKIERAAVSLVQADQDVKAQETARKAAATLVKQAIGQLATVLDPAGRPGFEASAGIGTIAETLKEDAKLLKGYAANASALGQALAQAFAP